VYVTAYDLQKSFSFDTTFEIIQVTYAFRYYSPRSIWIPSWKCLV